MPINMKTSNKSQAGGFGRVQSQTEKITRSPPQPPTPVRVAPGMVTSGQKAKQ